MWCNLFNSQSPLENFWMTWDSLFFFNLNKIITLLCFHYKYMFLWFNRWFIVPVYRPITFSHVFLACNYKLSTNGRNQQTVKAAWFSPTNGNDLNKAYHLNVFSQKMNKLFLLRKKLEIPRYSVNFVILDQSFSIKNCDMSSLPFILRMHVCCTYRCSISFHKPRL